MSSSGTRAADPPWPTALCRVRGEGGREGERERGREGGRERERLRTRAVHTRFL